MKIIAEAGVNHNGDIDRAIALVDAACEAGAHAVKFQTFRAELLATSSADKAGYQKLATAGEESQLAMIRKLELSQESFCQLAEHCAATGIEFLSTAFEEVSLNFLHDEIGLRTFKIASGELTNMPLLLAHARLADQLIVSTGMATLEEIEAALGVIAHGMETAREVGERPGKEQFRAAFLRAMETGSLQDRVTLLHCTTEYPAPLNQINLRAMATLQNTFRLPVGYSDHTTGITVPVVAAALGACVIEKHFTLDKSLPGPDHSMSLNPVELTSMVSGIADILQTLGDGEKRPGEAESRNIELVRKSLVASRDIRAGEVFTERNLSMKRPGSGVPPEAYWSYLGRTSDRDYRTDDLIQE
ncbi:N-acetylneuraminate synthase [Granulosicoccus sp. 3-233]|uniref:N-acetylneuraminate synthase n=1 Tax=Granulosicoccus sp. 3-233 TaxID=3417969 RepID=UPI003D34F8CD